ncbi:MAG TPA: hypothetical protein VHX44_02110, partial [Planctomycetota bacterium]|nr:hypothetical protein [Planctomycetota bacterium]
MTTSLLLAGCGGRAYDRVVIVGLLVPARTPVPASGARIQQLPPMPALGLAPDTADGSVLIAVDQQQFYHDHGYELPAYAKRSVRAEADPHLDDFRHLVEDLAAVRHLLDRVFGDLESDVRAEGQEHEAQPSGAPNRHAALVLKPGEWGTLVNRVMQVTIAIDHLAATALQPGPDGKPVDALNGEAIHQRRRNELWEGMETGVELVLLASETLASAGAFAELCTYPVHGPELEPLLATIRAQAQTVAALVHEQNAP